MKFFSIVPHKSEFILERLGKYYKILPSGLHFYIPFIDQVVYKQCIKERSIDILDQKAFTKDNVSIDINGAVFFQISDSYKASYMISDYLSSIRNLSMTTMRSEIGKVKLDSLFKNRSILNENIKNTLSDSTAEWGISILRYEILKINPPDDIKEKMELEVEAERIKRKDIIISEGQKEASILISEGERDYENLINEGHMNGAKIYAEFESKGIKEIQDTIESCGKNKNILKYYLNNRYFDTYKELMKENKIVVVPENNNGNNLGLLEMAAIFKSGNNNNNTKESNNYDLSAELKYIKDRLHSLELKESKNDNTIDKSEEEVINNNDLLDDSYLADSRLLYKNN